MSLKHGILGFLNYGSMTGYDLNKTFSESIEFFWHAQTSQIYRELGKLEKDGFVNHTIIIQNDKPNKKEYTITNEGKNELIGWLLDQSENELSDFKSEFLMKVFFSDSITLESSIDRLEIFKQDCISYAQSLMATSSTIDNYHNQVSNKNASIYWKLTADFGEGYIRMCIAWAEESIIKLRKVLNEDTNN